jgi:hypothetical protein
MMTATVMMQVLLRLLVDVMMSLLLHGGHSALKLMILLLMNAFNGIIQMLLTDRVRLSNRLFRIHILLLILLIPRILHLR